ncbi:hypothetical protein Pyn_02370 [Prunus yedoensis var. nudiflora]|uniref:Uncharacterized protein n=1 Tax=Prunus yedoensis var. nudiflora TaxID=2094558 RepID=A0A314Z170_PRUYE|nr:hypothetical protein Pyn_02370 [Prunus yedoensis var. nudiflora]
MYGDNKAELSTCMEIIFSSSRFDYGGTRWRGCRSSHLGLDVVQAVSVSMSFESSRSRCLFESVIVIVENPFHGEYLLLPRYPFVDLVVRRCSSTLEQGERFLVFLRGKKGHGCLEQIFG